MLNDDFKDKAWELIYKKQEDKKQCYKNIMKRVRSAHEAVIKGTPVVEDPEIDNA